MIATSPTILIVDDERNVRELLGEFLEIHDFQVMLAGSADAALSTLAQCPVQLVISDINMPGMTGTELLSHVTRQYPGLPVILITGNPDINTAVSTLQGGAVDYLTKPFDFAHLRQVITKALRQEALDSTMVMTSNERTINGFVLHDPINEGAMGIIYRAERHGQMYALKLINTECDDMERSRELLERFVREAELASRIRHPNIVQIIDYGISEEEVVPYIAMELVDGLPLDVMSKKIPRDDWQTRARLLHQIAMALQAIHDVGIYHRDIKPSNVLVTADMCAKVTDFGIAREHESDLTHADQILGSPLYMSPEIYLTSVVDNRSDIFSFGVMAYQFLVNMLPFDGSTIPAIARSVTREQPIQPRRIVNNFPGQLQQILAKALKKDPAERYQTASAMAEDLRLYLEEPDDWQQRLQTLTFNALRSADWR